MGFDVTAVEPSTSGLEFARRALPPSRVVQASAYEDLAATLGRFEIVTCLEVIEHCYYPRRVAACIRDLLLPNGTAIVSTPYHGYLKNLALAASGRLDAHLTVLWDGGHIKFFSARTIRTMLEECGYRVVAIRGAGRVPWLWKSMIVLARKQEPPRPNRGASV